MFERLLNTREVAELLNVSRTYIYYLIEQGELPAIRKGTAYQIHPDAVNQMLEAREVHRRRISRPVPARRAAGHHAPPTHPRRKGDGDPRKWRERPPFGRKGQGRRP